MGSRLDQIEDWELLASATHYSVEGLAKACNVSRRQVVRYFRARFGLVPHAWLETLRVGEAQTLLRAGEQVKLVAAKVGYAHVSSFSRAFKRTHSVGPSGFHHPRIVKRKR